MARGRYRILLGMAAGVGKTYRMLQEGRQAQAEGRDVVIGYLEPHDRPATSALAEGLEVVARLRSPYGGLHLDELDVDAVIARRPALALIDDLAPQALQERLEAGKVYALDRADAALTNFFKLENLSALRELALREVAED